MKYILRTGAVSDSGEKLELELDIRVKATADEGEGPKETEAVDDYIKDNSQEFVDMLMNFVDDGMSDEIGHLRQPTFVVFEPKQLDTY